MYIHCVYKTLYVFTYSTLIQFSVTDIDASTHVAKNYRKNSTVPFLNMFKDRLSCDKTDETCVYRIAIRSVVIRQEVADTP